MTKVFSFAKENKRNETLCSSAKNSHQKPGGFITTADLIKELTAEFKPQGEDAKILHNRADNKFSQVVRKIVSLRSDSKKNLVSLVLDI